MSKYPNWFEKIAESFFKKHLIKYKGLNNLNFLQLGAYTGDASIWLIENILTDNSSYLTDVDTWQGSYNEKIHNILNWEEIESVYDNRIKNFNNVIKYKSTTKDFFLKEEVKQYDFIYIDADHTAQSVFEDAENSWPKLKIGGILAFDDYYWVNDPDYDWLRPGPAIDQFILKHNKELNIIEKDAQVWISKKI